MKWNKVYAFIITAVTVTIIIPLLWVVRFFEYMTKETKKFIEEVYLWYLKDDEQLIEEWQQEIIEGYGE